MAPAAQDPGGAGKRGQFLWSTYGDPMEYLWRPMEQHATNTPPSRLQRAYNTPSPRLPQTLTMLTRGCHRTQPREGERPREP